MWVLAVGSWAALALRDEEGRVGPNGVCHKAKKHLSGKEQRKRYCNRQNDPPPYTHTHKNL
jgi:hypothetical protein